MERNVASERTKIHVLSTLPYFFSGISGFQLTLVHVP